MKRLLILGIISFMCFFHIFKAPVLATEDQGEKIEAIRQLFEEIDSFYLHVLAQDFLNNFYTQDSIENLNSAHSQVSQMKIHGWETELNESDLDDIYFLLRSAISNLSPLTMRRGEAVSFGEDLNFRSVPAVATQVLYRLPYGTPFEIIEEVAGESVTNENGSTSDLWFRIRHHDQSGFVHGRYVRAIPISAERIHLITDIARSELRIQSFIEGWRIQYSNDTRKELQEILTTARALQIENWQFDFDYVQLNDLLAHLSINHVQLVTLTRYELINRIITLVNDIENHIERTENLRATPYTEASWQQLITGLNTAQERLVEGWQDELSDAVLEEIYDLLRASLDGLIEIPPPEENVETVEVQLLPSAPTTDFSVRLRQFIFIFSSFIGLLIVIKIVKMIRQ